MRETRRRSQRQRNAPLGCHPRTSKDAAGGRLASKEDIALRRSYQSVMTLTLVLASAAGVAGARSIPADSAASAAGSRADPSAAVHHESANKRALTLTIYQNGLGLVHDRRRLELSPGSDRLTLLDLPSRLKPETLAVTLHPKAHILSQRFRSTHWTPTMLLQAYEGREVLLEPRTGEHDETRRALLVSAQGKEPIVRVGGRLELGGPDAPWRIVLPPDPRIAVCGPALDLHLARPAGGHRRVNLVYLTDGLGWQMDYWAELRGERLRLQGFARIVNHSAGGYPEAKVRLVAGDIERGDGIAPFMMQAQRRRQAAETGGTEPALAWHLYRLDQTVNLPRAAAIRLELLRTTELQAQRRYRVSANGTDTGGKAPVQVRLHVATDNAEHPLALPAGTVRVKEQGTDGEPRYLGADHIDHTPAGEPLDLLLGTAFDLTARRTRTLMRRLGKDHYEVAWRIELHNTRAKPVEVQLREELPGDWEIVQQSAPHERLSATIAQWSVAVPAQGDAVLSYQARFQR